MSAAATAVHGSAGYDHLLDAMCMCFPVWERQIQQVLLFLLKSFYLFHQVLHLMLQLMTGLCAPLQTHAWQLQLLSYAPG